MRCQYAHSNVQRNVVKSELEIEFLLNYSRANVGKYSHLCPEFEGMINMTGEYNNFEGESGWR